MFGVPFIFQVPQEGLTYNQLYLLIMNRMKRWIKVSEPEDGRMLRWVKEGEPEDGYWNPINTETEMQEEQENEYPPMEANSVEEEPIFTMDLVNSSGHSSINKLESGNKPLSLGGKRYNFFHIWNYYIVSFGNLFLVKSFITCEWDPFDKKKNYDAEAAEDYDEDASFLQRLTVKKQVFQLNECLELFTSTERLGADDAWLAPLSHFFFFFSMIYQFLFFFFFYL